jgi:hypothetical protein
MVTYWMLTVWFSRVRSLSIILDDVKVVLPQRDLTSERRKELVSITVGCYNVLNELDEALGKYQELGSDPKDCDSKSFRFKFRAGWKRLRWEPDDVKELRSRITSNISLLNAFNGQLIRYLPTPLLMRAAANPSLGKYLWRRKIAWIGCTSVKMT